MVLEFSIAHDGGVGRVLAFSGRFARLPDHAPELTTLHLLHGEGDPVIPVAYAQAAIARLKELGGDATLDIAASVATRSTRNWPTMPFAACRPIYPCAAGRRQWMALDAKQV